MLSIAHGPTGALIATKIGHPIISIPFVILSHYLEDHIPHWDVGQGLTSKVKSRKAAFWQELLIDFPLSILLVYFLFQYQKPFSILPWLGWFMGLLPDFLEAPRNFLGWEPQPLKAINQFHHWFHHSTPVKLDGLIPQVAVLLAIYFLR